MDPSCRLICLHLYDGALKVIPIDGDSALREAYNLPLEELKAPFFSPIFALTSHMSDPLSSTQVIDMAFLHSTGRPTLALLYEARSSPPLSPPRLTCFAQDAREARHLKSYELSLKDKDLLEAPTQLANLDGGAQLLSALPLPLCGCLVVGRASLAYVHGSTSKSLVMRQMAPTALCRVDADGARSLLGDSAGGLHLVALEQSGGAVTAIRTQRLGTTSVASTLSYLDSGCLFVGSAGGDSQLVRLAAADAGGSCVEVLDAFPSLGPVVDFCVVDLERQGQGQLVTCSGLGPNGSLRVVRNGVGIQEQACAELAGVKGLWALRAAPEDAHDTFLVVSFVSETRVLALSAEDELDETELAGFECDQQTLLVANAPGGRMLQVTPGGVFLADCASRARVAAWAPPAGQSLSLAACCGAYLLLGLGGGRLVLLEAGASQLTQLAAATLPHEVSCLDVSLLRGAPVACCGLWSNSVQLLALPSLAPLHEERIPCDAIPRSVLLALFEGDPYLLAGLGDGQLFVYLLSPETGALGPAKRLSLGSQPINLRGFASRGAFHVFAACDRPTVVYSLNGKLVFSNVNLREASHVCAFHTAAFPDALAVATEDSLAIGTVDDIQKLHVRCVPLGEQPRRIAHHEPSRTLLVACLKPGDGGEQGGSYSLRLLDDSTFDTVFVHPLEACEECLSLLACSFAEDDRTLYVAGTAFVMPDEPEPTRGRLLVFAVEDGKLRQIVRLLLLPLRCADCPAGC